MSNNYDASKVGVPYVRAHRITINYPGPALMPNASIEQSLVVPLADGTTATISTLPTINRAFDMINDGNLPIPLVDPSTGAALGPTTTLNQVMLSILAVVRQEQLRGA